jgi:hypothetical protein
MPLAIQRSVDRVKGFCHYFRMAMSKAEKRARDRNRRRSSKLAKQAREADDALSRARLADLKAAREAKSAARPDRDDAALDAKRRVFDES